MVKKFYIMIKRSVLQLNRTDPNIMTFIVYGLLYDIVINTYKPFAVKFLERLGGNELHISLYNSLPGLMAVLALIPGSIFIARFVRKKRVTTVFFVVARLFLVLLALIPFFNAELRPLLFVILSAVMNFPDAVSQCAFQSFLGENFEGSLRAKAISLRTKFGQIVIMIITVTTGLIIRFAPQNESQTLIAYQLFFATAFVVSIFEIIKFTHFKERSKAAEAAETDNSEKPSFKVLRGVLKDKKFKRFLVLTISFYVTWQIAWPIVGAYQVIHLKADEVWLAVFAMVSGVFLYLGASFWGRRIIKQGNDKMILFGVFGAALNVFLYGLAQNLWLMIFVSAYNGFMGSVLNITLLNGLLEATPDKNRVLYIATYNTMINVSLFLSPFLGYLLITRFSYFVTFSIIALMRGAVSLVMLLNYLRNKKSRLDSSV